MKALVLATSYPVRPGSVSGAFVREMLRGLTRLGWSFEVVTPEAAQRGAPATEPGIVAQRAIVDRIERALVLIEDSRHVRGYVGFAGTDV